MLLYCYYEVKESEVNDQFTFNYVVSILVISS